MVRECDQSQSLNGFLFQSGGQSFFRRWYHEHDLQCVSQKDPFRDPRFNSHHVDSETSRLFNAMQCSAVHFPSSHGNGRGPLDPLNQCNEQSTREWKEIQQEWIQNQLLQNSFRFAHKQATISSVQKRKKEGVSRRGYLHLLKEGTKEGRKKAERKGFALLLKSEESRKERRNKGVAL